MKKTVSLFLLFLGTFLLPATAQVQMVFKGEIGGTTGVELQVNGDPVQQSEIESIFQSALRNANRIDRQLSPKNPESETTKVLANPIRGTFRISRELAKLLDTALQVSLLTQQKRFKGVKVDPVSNDVIFKKESSQIDLEPFLLGFLADLIGEDLKRAGLQNTFLQLGNIYASNGHDFNGSWKIPVVDNRSGYAKRALYYKVGNAAVASALGNGNEIKSVTVFSGQSAAKAQGLANAAVQLDLKEAQRLLKNADIPKAVLINANGEFLQFPPQKK